MRASIHELLGQCPHRGIPYLCWKVLTHRSPWTAFIIIIIFFFALFWLTCTQILCWDLLFCLKLFSSNIKNSMLIWIQICMHHIGEHQAPLWLCYVTVSLATHWVLDHFFVFAQSICIEILTHGIDFTDWSGHLSISSYSLVELVRHFYSSITLTNFQCIPFSLEIVVHAAFMVPKQIISGSWIKSKT